MACAGIIYLNDIMNGKGGFLKATDVEHHFQCSINWLEYRGIFEAVPKEWVKHPTQANMEEDSLFQNIQRTAKPVSIIYAKLIDENCKLLYYYNLFQKKVSCTWDKYISAFNNINKITHITKYRDFQYRLLCRTIHANDELYHWKIVPKQDCEYCNNKQNVIHLMFLCPKIQRIWKELHKFLSMCTKIDGSEIKLNKPTIMLNNTYPKPKHLLNILTLIVKQHICHSG